jgi:hypothetical protein
MNNATTPAQSRNLDQILDEGNIQSFITKNKSAVIYFFFLLFVGVFIF